jgi:hypothetical protein
MDNEHGIDTLSRTFFGFTDEIYKLAPRKGDKDKWIPSMRCTDRSFIENRGLAAQVTCTYKGLLDDKIPDLIVTGGWSEESVQLPVVTGVPGTGLIMTSALVPTADPDPGNADQVQDATVTYHAPRSTFLYVTRKRPTGPKYAGQLLISVFDFAIVDIRPARLAGRPAGELVVRCVRYDVAPVGAYWQVTEEQKAMLIPLSGKDLKHRVLMTGQLPPGKFASVR